MNSLLELQLQSLYGLPAGVQLTLQVAHLSLRSLFTQDHQFHFQII